MEELAQLKKLPPWAWGLAIAGGLGLWWFSTHQPSSSGSSSASGAASVLPPLQGSVNTQAPNCPSYPVPTCSGGQTLTWSYDNQGCPMQVCSTNGGNNQQTDQYVTTNGKTSFYSASQVYSCWGDARIRFWASTTGLHPELASTSVYTDLPAGIRLKVCGTFP